MTFPVKGRKKVTFRHRPRPAMSSPVSPTTKLNRLLNPSARPQRPGFVIESLSDDDNEQPEAEQEFFVHRPKKNTSKIMAMNIPPVFTSLPAIRDLLNTKTSQLQETTVAECLPFLSGAQAGLSYNEVGVPHLDRKRHIAFLHKTLETLPSPYVAADASRPWMFYWALCGLSNMGESIDEYRERLIATVTPMQNVTGGFGGGHGQMSHLAPTYAVLLSLAMVGGKEALDLVDRKAMWTWLGKLKQADGGFQMSLGGEEDVRGALCAAVTITLLDLPLDLPTDSPGWSREGDNLLTNLPEWVARCQTFEGGISSRPDAEAHGAYAFCALACLCIIGEPHIIMPKYLDIPRLTSWLSARQYGPEGGFAGRTNKLVDGCYSHWVGGCWPLVQACLDGPSSPAEPVAKSVGSIYSREGLIRYILCCCQDTTKRGGLRDKPTANVPVETEYPNLQEPSTSDSYHTCYVLAGLSFAQHKWHYNPKPTSISTTNTTTTNKNLSSTSPTATNNLIAAYTWTSEPIHEEPRVYDEPDRVGTLHPVFVIPEGVAERTRAYFVEEGRF